MPVFCKGTFPLYAEDFPSLRGPHSHKYTNKIGREAAAATCLELFQFKVKKHRRYNWSPREQKRGLERTCFGFRFEEKRREELFFKLAKKERC